MEAGGQHHEAAGPPVPGGQRDARLWGEPGAAAGPVLLVPVLLLQQRCWGDEAEAAEISSVQRHLQRLLPRAAHRLGTQGGWDGRRHRDAASCTGK